MMSLRLISISQVYCYHSNNNNRNKIMTKSSFPGLCNYWFTFYPTLEMFAAHELNKKEACINP